MIRSAGRKRFAHAGQSPTRCATMILLAHSDSRVHPRAAVWVSHRPKRLAGPEMKPSATCTKAQCKLHYIDADQAELMYSPSLANRRSLLSARGDVILINSNLGSKAFLRPPPIACATAALRHIGLDEPRCHCVHSDVVRTKLHGKASGQNRNFGFRRCIERIAGQRGADRGNRAYVDDPAVPPFPHAGRDGARGVDYSLDVDPAHACNLLRVV